MQKQKEFWKYFFDVFKRAKWLILRYLIVALYLTTTSIFANKLNLENLTYFNAILGLSLFAEFIGFGIANAIGTYINQNFQNKKNIKIYVKSGIKIAVIVSLIFVFILLVFNNFVLFSILKQSTKIDKNFYFFMLFYIFFASILSYFVHILKFLNNFLPVLITSILQFLTLLFGFLFNYFCLNLSLNFIAINFVLATIISITYSLCFLQKKYKINLFSKEKLTSNIIQKKFVFKMLFQQLICQISLVLTSYFILKSNKLLFNQYAYFENVLDIFNGLFFAFASIINIDICQELGKQNFKKAYKIGKFAIVGTAFVWLLYFCCCLIFSKLLLSGMNNEILQNNFYSMILYTLLHLLRFVCWILNCYILCSSGEMKILLIEEIVCSLYFMYLYIFASFWNLSVVAIYLMIALPSIFEIIIGILLFRQKKWLKKI